MTFQQPHNRAKTKRKLPRELYRWHRRIGASAALFVVWIVISGWLLNHSDSLKLAQQQIYSPALAHWYNLHYAVPTKIFNSKNHWLVNNDETLILDSKILSTQFSNVIGLTQSEQFIAIASNHEILLLDAQNQVVDKLNESSLPFKYITKIGSGCDGIAITDADADADDNNPIHTLSSQDGLEWQPCSQPITWSTAKPINTDQLKQLEPQLVPAISVEKIIIDLHTGRFFGRYGAFVVDVIGLCLMLLALSGLWLFLRNSRKNH
jgi:hypothetical protein